MKSFKSIGVLVSLAMAAAVSASADIPGKLPEPMVLEGVDGRFACRLIITHVYYTAPTQTLQEYRLVAQTNYAHDDATSPAFEISFNRFSADAQYALLQGTTDQKEVIRLQTPAAHPEAENTIEYRIKWLHGDHYHNNICKNLKRIR